MLIIIALGVFIGYKLDQSYPNQYQIFSILFSIIAIIVSIYYVIRQARAVPIFINSLGWIVILFSVYHDNAPLMVSPNKNRPNRKNKQIR